MGFELMFCGKKPNQKVTKKYREKLGFKAKMSIYTVATKN